MLTGSSGIMIVSCALKQVSKMPQPLEFLWHLQKSQGAPHAQSRTAELQWSGSFSNGNLTAGLAALHRAWV